MSKRTLAALAAVCLFGAASAMAVSFTWTANGSDDDWDTCNNWNPATSSPPNCFPGGGGGLGIDDAIIPSGTWTVNLFTYTIDDLSIAGATTFVDGSGFGTSQLNCDSVTLAAGGSGFTATMSSGAKIETY